MSLKKWILALAVFLVLLALAAFLLKPAPPLPIKLPNPNGYDDLVAAMSLFVGQRPDCNFDNSECIDEWKSFFRINSDALKRVRIGLSRDSRVPISREIPLSERGAFLSLAQILMAEGDVADKEKRLDDSIASYLDLVRLSQQARGGAMSWALLSVAIEGL
ncbi:MAG: hypothetical protein ABIP71_16065, partial [Verrucomicrobiota bacterium]